jgi:uncharacterized protein (DUF488 family)
MHEKTIWTIGHSTHSIDQFTGMLNGFAIQMVADIRRFPGSKWFPQYNKDFLLDYLKQHEIDYRHFEALGGRRTPAKDSRNSGWRVAAFRGYADYMETETFKKEVIELEVLAVNQRVAYMCSEAVWWSCHRALVSDYLKHKGWTVMHIMGPGKSDEHPWTKPARIENDKLVYSPPNALGL